MYEVRNDKETIINANKILGAPFYFYDAAVLQSQTPEFIHTTVLIPAYDIDKKGTVFNPLVDINPCNSPSINSYGSVAALTKMLERIISITLGWIPKFLPPVVAGYLIQAKMTLEARKSNVRKLDQGIQKPLYCLIIKVC